MICTIIVSLVTPGSTKSSKEGVIISFSPVLLLFITKNMFELPASPTLPSHKYNTSL